MLPADATLEINLVQSVEYFLYQNVVLPYNTAVTGTNFDAPLQIMLDNPDDAAIEAKVPAIVLCEPYDYKDPEDLGVGESLVWLYKTIAIEVYPAVAQDTAGSNKPSIQAASMIRSLFGRITTGLTLPLYATFPVSNGQTPDDVAYLTHLRLQKLHGKVSTLALEKHRFDYIFSFRFVQPVLSG